MSALTPTAAIDTVSHRAGDLIDAAADLIGDVATVKAVAASLGDDFQRTGKIGLTVETTDRGRFAVDEIGCAGLWCAFK